MPANSAVTVLRSPSRVSGRVISLIMLYKVDRSLRPPDDFAKPWRICSSSRNAERSMVRSSLLSQVTNQRSPYSLILR